MFQRPTLKISYLIRTQNILDPGDGLPPAATIGNDHMNLYSLNS